MTETEWLRTTDGWAMLAFLRNGIPLRQLRCFSTACVRTVWDLLPEESRRAVETAERWLDGQATDEDLDLAQYRACQVRLRRHPPSKDPTWLAAQAAVDVSCPTDQYSKRGTLRQAATNAMYAYELAYQPSHAEARIADLLRCVVQPFHAMDFSPVPPVVRSLALAAYQERLLPSGELDPARLAVLSDALEEAGAASEMLKHLRGPGPHVRGCWVIECLISPAGLGLRSAAPA